MAADRLWPAGFRAPAPIRNARARASLAWALLRLGRTQDTLPLAVHRAIGSVVFARIPSDERAWIERIEGRRRELAASPRTVTFPVLGARPGEPSRAIEAEDPRVVEQPVSQWSGLASVTRVWGAFLTRLVRELAPDSCLELGTGFGLSGAYQAAALELNGRGRLVTLDGAAARAAIAREGFERLGLDRVELRVGRLGEILETELAGAEPVDYAFVDANHEERAIRQYYDLMIPHLADHAVVVFDDINWSRGMRRAWGALRVHPHTALAVGAGRMGVCVTGRSGKGSGS